MNIVVFQIFGYNIHLAFFLLLFFIGAIAAIIYILKNKLDEKTEILDDLKITTWQKTRLVDILSEEKINFIEEKGEINEETGEKFLYVELIEKFQNYLIKEDVWDVEKFAAIDERMILLFTTVIMAKSKEFFVLGDKNTALLLAHVVDLMNGGKYLSKEVEDWIGDDIAANIKYDDMDINDARLLTLAENSIYSLAKAMYFSADKRNPETPEYLDHIILDDLDDALSDVLNTKTFLELQPNTYEVLSFAMYEEIDQILKSLTEDKLREFQLYHVRALCCTIDEELYDFILQTIA